MKSWDALKAKPAPGRPPKLNAVQMQWFANAIREKDPRQLSFYFAFWTLAMVRELIRRKFDVHLSEVSVGRVLKTLVNQWKTTEYPKIRERAKRENALIFFGDESGIRSDY
ncbi:MAG: winged helix-turn-helix domain-containing protein, partial [Deltaproteobacteria bacterium]|nr:winged helix-turn-helix domain-containing protein [Deltaproteobacteria bacterium]